MEKKRAYVKPSLESEAFVPNTYVAACGDSGVTYLFECNAGEPYRYWEEGWFGGHWVTDDHPYKVTTDGGRVLTRNYGPCNAKHSAPSESGFLHGFMDNTHTDVDEHIPVIIWTEWGTNVHCTENLDQDSWETLKS